MTKQRKKIIRYKKTKSFNIGIAVFAVIFLYLSAITGRYLLTSKMKMYEVLEGDLANTSYYTGIALRSETVVTSEYAGYVNYYLRERQKAAVGNLIYTVDESGALTDYLNNSSGSTSRLSDENLKELKAQLSSFSASYSDGRFSEVYDVNAALSSMLMEYMNLNTLAELSGQAGSEASVSFQKCPARLSGLIFYSSDGMEGLTPEQLSADAFTEENYNKTVYSRGMLVKSGDPVYRVITEDAWSVAIPLSEEDLAQYNGKASLTVHFTDRGLDAQADFSVIQGADGASYGILSLDKYMIQFAGDRYIELEIKTSQAEGLKLPKTALTSQDAFVIPARYLTTGGDSLAEGFYKEIYREDGSVSTEFVTAHILRVTSEGEKKAAKEAGEPIPDNCYVSTSDFSQGDMIILPDSNERFRVAEKQSLPGVYNVNRGYASFRYVNVIDENQEYCIAEKNVYYSIRAYDHIALHGSEVREGEILR